MVQNSIQAAGMRPDVLAGDASSLTAEEWEIWCHQLRHPLSAAYNITAVIEVEGPVDAARLESAVRASVGRHERLTSRIEAVGTSGARWVNLGPDGVDVERLYVPDHAIDVHDWTSGSGAQLLQQEAQTGFHGRGSLHRFKIWQLGRGAAAVQITLHHVICDGLSLRLLVDEIVEGYDSDELERRSSEHVTAFVPHVSDEEARHFWAERPGKSGKHSLLVRDFEGAGPTGPGELVSRELDLDLRQWTTGRGQDWGITAFAAVSQAIAWGLATAVDVQDVVLHVPVSIRRPQDDHRISYRVRLLPVTFSPVDGSSVRSLFERAQDEMLAVAMHADPESWSPDSEPDSGAGTVVVTNQLSPSGMLTHQRPAGDERSGLTWRPYLIHNGTAKFDLTIFVGRIGEKASLAVEFRRDRYARDTVERLCDRLAEAVEYLLTREADDAPDPRALVAQRRPYEQGDRVPLVRRRRAQDAFHERATDRPWTTCLVEDRRGIEPLVATYGQLAQASQELASRLIAAGAGPGHVVGIQLHRGISLYAAVYGVLSSGAAFLLLDPELPPDRVQYMLEDSKVSLVLQQAERASADAHVVLPGSEPIVITKRADAAEVPLADQTSSRDVAYVMYTSGTTGKPKGVAVPHDGIVNRVDWMQRQYGLTTEDRVLCKTPLSFDVCVWELLWPLAAGSTVVLCQHGRHGDAEYLVDAIERYSVDTLHYVPTMLIAFLEVATRERCRSLRRVFASGERLPRTLAERVRNRLGLRIHNLYGPTEASIDVTAYTYDPDDGLDFVPIGRPIDNAIIRILDRLGQPCDYGQVGEIVIVGVGVALGYVGDGSLDKGKFEVDALTGLRTYRTGDLGRWRTGGVIEFLGRSDGQVKINGQRVELDEVEVALAEVPGVVSAGVDYDSSRPLRERLRAYLVVDQAQEPTVPQVRRNLVRLMPAHMIPKDFAVVAALPLTSSGKLDRVRLPDLLRRSLSDDASDPSRGERPHLGAWGRSVDMLKTGIANVIGGLAADVPEDVDLALIGLDSISVLQLVADLEGAGLSLSVADVFEARTVANLAARLSTTPGTIDQVSDVVTVGDSPEPASSRIPMSQLGLGLVFHRDMSDDYVNYVTNIELRGHADVTLLERAIVEVAGHHEILRSSVDVTDASGPQHVIHSDVALDVDERTYAGLDEDDALTAFRSWQETARSGRFMWSDTPLFKFVLHRFSAERSLLSVVEPLLDGWSVAVLIRDILDAYECIVAANESVDPPESAKRWLHRRALPSYGEFIQLERAAESSEISQSFWRSVVSSPDVAFTLAVPKDLHSGPRDWARLDYVLTESELAALLDSERRMGVPLRTLLLTAHARTVAAYSGRPSVGTAVVTNGRPERAGGAEMCGLFLNMVPLVVDVDSAASWRDLTDVVATAEHKLWRHRRFPFAAMRQFVPEFEVDTLFNFTNFHRYGDLSTDASRQLEMESISGLDQTYFNLTVQASLSPKGDRVRISVDYRRPAISDVVARGFLDHLSHYLRMLCTDADAGVWRSPLAGHAAAQIDAWSKGSDSGEPGEVPHLADLVDGKAETEPDAIAIEDSRESMSYRSVSDWSSSVAALLLEMQGNRSALVVGVVAHRSCRYWASVLAIWRAGGTYVPVSSELPVSRMVSIVEQARLSVIMVDDSIDHEIVARLANTGARILNIADVVVAADSLRGMPAKEMAETAYVVFTSGTTGRPKGARIGPRAMVNHWHSKVDVLALDADCVLVQSAPPSFDISIWQWAVPWFVGGKVVVWGSELLLDPTELMSSLVAQGVSVYETVPTHLATLLDVIEAGDAAVPDLSTLRHLMVTGEAVPAPLVDRWLYLSSVPVVNAYGPTECADDVTHAVIAPGRGATPDPVPIGSPIRNVRLDVVDPGGVLVPPGVAGELRVSGHCLGDGYVDPVDDVGRFVTCAGFDGAEFRAYMTGDYVRWDESGSLVWLGRMDDEVKIRGRRISLGDIEANLLSHPSVRQAAVVADGKPARTLRAFMVCGAEVSAPELKQYLADRVPAWMVPDAWQFMQILPVTQHGKIDRRALLNDSLDSHEPVGRAGNAVSRAVTASEVARVVVEEWERVLSREIPEHGDFYELGGSSLDSVRVVARIGHRIDVRLSVRDLRDASGLAAFIDRVTQLRAGHSSQLASNPSRVRTTSLSPERGTSDQPWVEGTRWVAHPRWDGLLSECPEGRLDAAAVGYLSLEALARSGLTRREVREAFASVGGLALRRLLHTPLGVIGHYVIPVVADELYSTPEETADRTAEAVSNALDLGAGRVALTGLLPSALDYGRLLASRVPSGTVVTGHDVTAAAVALNVRRQLREAGTTIAEHDLGVVGLGSIGATASRLLLDRIGTPRRIAFFETKAMLGRARSVADELEASFDLGPIEVFPSTELEVNPALYKYSLIVGAANTPNIVDVQKFRRGAVLVDDSAPHMMDVAAAARRVQRQELRATEGGMLWWPSAVRETRWVPKHAGVRAVVSVLRSYRVSPRSLMGCVAAGLIGTSASESSADAVGLVPRSLAQATFDHLVATSFDGVPMMLEDASLEDEQ